jgi:hypothetical protein
MPLITDAYRFLATVPYRAPKLPEDPTLYVRPKLFHYFTFDKIVLRSSLALAIEVATIFLISSGEK